MSDKIKKKLNRIERIVLVCNGSDCKKKGAKSLRKALKKAAKDEGVFRSTHICKTKCNGFCKGAPIVGFSPANEWLMKTDEDEACEVFRKLVRGG
jgi:NADH:ubiquinone oxidoreductase subunit E